MPDSTTTAASSLPPPLFPFTHAPYHPCPLSPCSLPALPPCFPSSPHSSRLTTFSIISVPLAGIVWNIFSFSALKLSKILRRIECKNARNLRFQNFKIADNFKSLAKVDNCNTLRVTDNLRKAENRLS